MSQPGNVLARYGLPGGQVHLFDRAPSFPGYRHSSIVLAVAQPGQARLWRLGMRLVVGSAARQLISSRPSLIYPLARSKPHCP